MTIGRRRTAQATLDRGDDSKGPCARIRLVDPHPTVGGHGARGASGDVVHREV
jgi:hypothetical protein